MDQIRFNQPMTGQTPSGKVIVDGRSNDKNPNIIKKVFKYLLFILIIAAVVVVGFLFKDKIFINSGVTVEAGASPYSAVFLSNGQVYFGKMISRNESEVVLSNVYYLQLSENGTQTQTQANEPKFTLIKLGNEIHGPTDKLYINVSQVLFYESLREDSQVVQSIKTQK